MGESLFEFLFKYRPLLFERGEILLAAPRLAWLAAVLAAAALAFTALSYTRVKGKTRPVDRAVLIAFRGAALALIAFCLFRPTLVVSTAVPQRNFVGVLVDDSRSMQVADRGDETRATAVQRALAPDGELFRALSERFLVRTFRFSSTAERVDDVTQLTFAGEETRLGRALDRVREELSAVPLAGLVLVTDGADNSDDALTEPLLALRAANVPVYTVGVGRERFTKDIEVTRVETPRTALQGSSLVVDLVVTQSGYAGETVPLQVEDAGRIVARQDIRLPRDGEATTVRVHFKAEEPGARTFRFYIPPRPGEMVAQNNEQHALIVVERRREKILYLEGEPRFEVKFLRRAVADDENLQVVVLQRTAENKFLRLDVDDAEELAAGFPRTREELFRYRALILGNVEASFFTHDQLQMIADFVDQRGGGLLVLGGRRALAEGGYAGTPVADVLPIVLDPADREERGSTYYVEVKPVPTRAGQVHPAVQIAPTPEESRQRWQALPPVSVVNRVRGLKPGATALLMGSPVGGGDEAVILAHQRYGRGSVLALPVQDTWQWQFHADVPLDDLSHETFWRQILRWLVTGVPRQVDVRTPRDRVAPGEPVIITADVRDATYIELNGATVTAHVAGPAGIAFDVPLEWTVDRDGEYRGSFTPPEPGLYEVRVRAQHDDAVIEGTAWVEAAPPVAEYFGAQMRASLLRRIADETGGRFYTLDDVATLPEDIRYTERGTTVQEQKDLWDMPIVFLLLVGLIGAEWTYRRLRGLI